MMTDDSLRSLVLDVLKQVAPEADVNHLDPARSFREQIGIDSVDFLNFVIGLEARLGRRIAELDYPQLSSLNGCLAYLRAADAGARPAPVPQPSR